MVVLVDVLLRINILYWLYRSPWEILRCNVRGAGQGTHMWAVLSTSGDGEVSSASSGDVAHANFCCVICLVSFRVASELWCI